MQKKSEISSVIGIGVVDFAVCFFIIREKKTYLSLIEEGKFEIAIGTLIEKERESSRYSSSFS